VCLLLVFFSSFKKFFVSFPFEMFVCPFFLLSSTRVHWVPIAIDVMKERQTGDGLTVEYIEYVIYCLFALKIRARFIVFYVLSDCLFRLIFGS
jgi:hypothetical protein